MNLRKVKTFTQKHPLLKKLLYPAIMTRQYFLKRINNRKEEVYKHLCELLCEDLVIKVDEFQGVFAVDCQSDLFKRLLLYKEYEPSLAILSLKYLDVNRDVMDIGANVGFYSILFAKNLKKAKVLAVEPTTNSQRRLHKNIQLNNVMDKIIVFPGAASDYNGMSEIKVLDGKEEYSTLGQWKHPSIKNENFVTQEIEVSTVDNLVDKYSLNPGFIKIDVEGLEYLVLRGSKNTLENMRPVILSEISDFLLKQNGSSAKEVINLMESSGYIVADADNLETGSEISEPTNILCIPKELGT